VTSSGETAARQLMLKSVATAPTAWGTDLAVESAQV
jgi:hypothetical protein